MEMKRVFETIDNRTFEEESEARTHEAEIAIELLEEHLNSFDCDACPAREICGWINNDDDRAAYWEKRLCHFLS